MKKEILKAARGKKYTSIENNKHQNTADFLTETARDRREWNNAFKVLQQKMVELGFCTQEKYL